MKHSIIGLGERNHLVRQGAHSLTLDLVFPRRRQQQDLPAIKHHVPREGRSRTQGYYHPGLRRVLVPG